MAVGLTIPGSTRISNSSRTSPSSLIQWTTSPVLRSMMWTPHQGSASRRFSSSSSASPEKESRGSDSVTMAWPWWKSSPRRKPGQKVRGSKLPDPRSMVAGAGIQHPQAAIMEARAVRHGQPLGDDLARRDIDDRAAFGPPVAPAIDDIAPADRRDIGGAAVGHGHAVQMAAILGSEPADEFGRPIGAEAVDRAQGRKA